MKIKILGAAQEVGRSGFLVNCNGTNFLLDYGVLFARRNSPPQYPLHVRPKNIDSIIISHAHLDHSGNVPSLFVSRGPGVYATPPTFDLTQLLLEDMLKIEKGFHQFDLPEINKMMSNSHEIQYGQKITRGEGTFELRNSGHVLGGSTVIVESNKKRLFYTGDINPRGSRILKEADLNIGEIDLLITESTYSQAEQMPRKEAEHGLIEFANEVIDRKGVLFIPSFSVERSQEIACVLKNANFKHKIIMDGMALKVNEIMFRHPDYLKDPKLFADYINETVSIRNHLERKKAVDDPCVIISPAGMLVGGNAVFYLQQLSFDNKNGIALVSYQGEDTPGRKLLETGKISSRGHDLKVSAEVKQFEFSGHADRNDLFEFIKNIDGNPKVWTVHGDNESCLKFAEEIKEKFGLEANSPHVDEIIEI